MHSGGCTLGAASRSERQAGCASWAAPCFPKARRPLWQSIETLILQFSALPLLVERLQGAPQCMQATTRWTGAASGAGRDGTWNASPAHLPVTEAARHLGVMVYDVKHDAAALEPVAWQKRGGGGGGRRHSSAVGGGEGTTRQLGATCMGPPPLLPPPPWLSLHEPASFSKSAPSRLPGKPIFGRGISLKPRTLV